MVFKKGAKGTQNEDLFDAGEISSFVSGKDESLVQADPLAVPEPSPKELHYDPLAAPKRERTTIDSSAFAQMYAVPSAEKQRYSMDRRKRWIFILAIILVAAYLLTVLLPTRIFNMGTGVTPAQLSDSFQANIEYLTAIITGSSATGLTGSTLLISILVALVGASLATTGAAYQGSFRNPLASPSTLGVMSGASLGMVFYTVGSKQRAYQQAQLAALGGDTAAASQAADGLSSFGYYISTLEGAFCALIGAMVVVLLTVGIAKLVGRGKIHNATLIIAGQVFASIASAVVVLFRLYLQTTGGQDAVESFAMMQTGDFSYVGTVYDLLFLGIPLVLGMAIVLALSSKLNLIAFGDEEARSMGLRVELIRGLLIFACTVTTAFIVAFVGSIGFVGFLIPHMVRRLVGPDFRYLVPASMLAGAAFMLIVYYLYSCIVGLQGGIGLVTTCVGAVVFIIAIVQERRVPHEERS